LAFPLRQRNGGVSLPQPLRGTGNGTLARRDADGRRDCKPSARQGCCAKRSAASRSERASVARPARREAGAPAGQPKDSAPLRARRERVRPQKIPLIFSGAFGPLVRQRSSPSGRDDKRRLGEANPRRRDRGIERGAGLPAEGKILDFRYRHIIVLHTNTEKCELPILYTPGQLMTALGCGSAWKRDPVSGVIGVE